MSIWGSDVKVSAAGEPYTDCLTDTGYYASTGSLDRVPRGGWMDFATSGMCDLARLCVALDGERLTDEVRLFLDVRQVRALVEAGQAWLDEQAREAS